jgi:hypothetical protein
VFIGVYLWLIPLLLFNFIIAFRLNSRPDMKSPLNYLGTLLTGKTALWCYLIVMFSPRLAQNLTALGACALFAGGVLCCKALCKKT